MGINKAYFDWSALEYIKSLINREKLPLEIRLAL